MMTALDRADFGGLLAVAAFVARRVGWDRFLKGVAPPVLRRMFEEWFWQAHGGQAEPPGDWRTWLLMAGRGFGKTLAGSQWVHARAREGTLAGTCPPRIALVGWSVDEVRKVMIEGPGGLLAAARSGEPVLWNPTQGVLRFASGAEAFVYSAAAPEKLRGPEHDFAWCDELAKWERGDRVWDNLQMGLRRGTRPRLIVTTTPRAGALVRRVRGLAGTVETNGRTSDNVHSAEAFRDWAVETYGGTRLGRQELDGMLFEEPEGALWPREILEKARVEMGTVTFPHAGDGPGEGLGKSNRPLRRVVVGVDPPASADGDACGIVVCGLGQDEVAYVLADCSVSGMRPEGWARAVALAAADWGADRVIAEKNQGGDMVESVLRSVDATLPVKLVSASRGKVARAEPVAARFETKRARLAGRFPELEDELAGLTLGGGYEGPGRSPDRADAMVWAMTELIGPPREPRVRGF
jgi:phage terminase large subunit-like protein